MSNLQTTSIGYISPHGDFSRQNTQALGGISHLWSDFFAQAMAEQVGDAAEGNLVLPGAAQDPEVEPAGGGDVLAQILSQRLCDVQDTEVQPPEPLFLPKAEFDTELLDKPAPPYPPEALLDQQKQLDFDNGWVRPIVMNANQPQPEPGPAPEPTPLFLPIAEFEWDLADKHVPYDEQTLAEQDKAFAYDTGWARPLIVNNLRLAA
ncbi:energy transducer TonB [Pseudomonas eucalypticola]|uniref:Energy transducer TonB n=1 Tax=Pseudomonas eucalypticola TaxID=2599595 RepID=A0A7D5DB14_9PSED|nr:energy transducer TonB [Pseudomonas eucalypticola]QKZ06355.1 energy transducer TonB [Pseudomonas eucalypticola]